MQIGVALEEMEIPYDAHTIDIFKNTQFEDWYVKINPNSKIPSIVDPNGPGKKPPVCTRSGLCLNKSITIILDACYVCRLPS